MKQSLKMYIALILLLCAIAKIELKSLHKHKNLKSLTSNKKLKITPKAEDLKDHFGTAKYLNQYGPNILPNAVDLDRVSNEVPQPFYNYADHINENTAIESGRFDNVSPDSSRIINAPLAKPRVEFKNNYIHEAIVHTPVHLGNKTEIKDISIYDRATGKVRNKIIKEKKPVLAILNTVRQIAHPHSTVINLETSKIEDENDDEKCYHGVEPNIVHVKK